MNKKQFLNLKRGDIIRHKNEASSYMVDDDYDEYKVIVKTMLISNSDEWDLIFESNYKHKNIIEDEGLK